MAAPRAQLGGAGCPGEGAPLGDAHTSSCALGCRVRVSPCRMLPAWSSALGSLPVLWSQGDLSCWEADLGVPGLALPCSCWVCRDQLWLCAPQVELQLLLNLADADREAEKSQGCFLFRAGRKLWSEGSTSPCTEHSFNSTLTTSPSVSSRFAVGWLGMQLGHTPVCSQLFPLLCSL